MKVADAFGGWPNRSPATNFWTRAGFDEGVLLKNLRMLLDPTMTNGSAVGIRSCVGAFRDWKEVIGQKVSSKAWPRNGIMYGCHAGFFAWRVS